MSLRQKVCSVGSADSGVMADFTTLMEIACHVALVAATETTTIGEDFDAN